MIATSVSAHMFSRHKIKYGEKMQILSCSVCDFSTNVRSRFQDHMRRHLNMRDIPCAQCGKLFVTRKTLRAHIAKVHSPKRFKCSQCLYAAGTATKLREHNKMMHTHRHFKPFKCPYCKFLCATSGNCRKHVSRQHPSSEVKYIKLTEEEFNAEMQKEESNNSLERSLMLAAGKSDLIDGQKMPSDPVMTSLALQGSMSHLGNPILDNSSMKDMHLVDLSHAGLPTHVSESDQYLLSESSLNSETLTSVPCHFVCPDSPSHP